MSPEEEEYLPIGDIDISGARFWSFDVYLAQVVAVALEKFREDGNGYPLSFESFEEWQSTLDEMREGFELYISDGWNVLSLPEEHPDRVKWENSKNLLIRFWEDLWD